MTEFQIRVRSFIFQLVAVVAFVILALQLWNLQVIQTETYQRLADANRFRDIQVPAARGVMYDRNGELLVRNRPTYNVVIIPAFLPEDSTAQARVFSRLSELLNLPITTQNEPQASLNNGHFNAIQHHQYNRQLQRQIINPRSRQYINAPLGIRDAVNRTSGFAPFLPVPIAEDVNPLIIARLEEERLDLPGVQIDVEPAREYIYGELTSHVIGYTGPIPAEQLPEFQALGYDITDQVGVAGLEDQYEAELRGTKGLESIEVDVTGQRIRTVSETIPSEPGHNLKLTLDIGLQEATRDALQAKMDEVESEQAVAIAMNPQTGEILAMVSLPSFDNNAFSRGITPRELARLVEDPWTPLINHATAGLYPPGSTFKIIPAAGALQEGVVEPDTSFLAEGILYLPNQFEPDNFDLAQPFYCWLRTGHGEVDVMAGLANSCDIYFYYVVGGYAPSDFVGLGPTRMGNYMSMFGLGELTGIDLPGEVSGVIPDQQWKRLNYAETWVTGDTYNMSIGQGFVLSTPLQILNATAAIANGGTLYRPYLMQEITDAEGNIIDQNGPQPIRSLDLDPQHIRLIQNGLRAVIDWDTGTAHEQFDVPGIVASGKTGTSEFCERYPQCIDADGRVQTSHAWFTAYAPSDNPEIAVVVFVYGGDEGSATAVPIANAMLRHYFDIDDTEEETTEEDGDVTDINQADAGPTFEARLLGTDVWGGEGAAVSGFVLDENNEPLASVQVDVIANGQVLENIITGEDGRFDYVGIDPAEILAVQLRLPAHPDTPILNLEVADGLRYLVEFEAQGE